MVARIACFTLALGVLVGCYNLPQPECGFACGPAGACPSDYSCNTAVNRCELSGTTPSCAPAPGMDAGIDTIRDSQDDFIRPTVIGRIPDDGAGQVPIESTITVTFSERVFNVNASTMRLFRGGTEIDGDVAYDDPSMTSATFTPLNVLEPGGSYSVTLLDLIVDEAGNALQVTSGWNFMTVDTVAPTVIGRGPAVDAVNVGVGAPVFVTFSEQVFGASASSFTVSQGATPVAGTVSYSIGPPSRATFTQSTQLLPNTTYTVDVGSPITDTSFNALTPVTWMFTTGADLQAPIVVTRMPAAASAGVSVTTQVTASFDENVMNVTGATFTLTPQGGSPVAATVTYVPATRTATVTPDLQLAPNTEHTATLTSAVTDVSGNPLAAVSWTFTTGADTIGPRVALTTPPDLATAVATSSTIAIQFDEPVQNVSTATFTVNGGAITGTIALSAGDTIATFTPDAALPASATISVNLTTAITDASSNALAAPLAFSFMTGP